MISRVDFLIILWMKFFKENRLLGPKILKFVGLGPRPNPFYFCPFFSSPLSLIPPSLLPFLFFFWFLSFFLHATFNIDHHQLCEEREKWQKMWVFESIWDLFIFSRNKHRHKSPKVLVTMINIKYGLISRSVQTTANEAQFLSRLAC